MTLKEMKLKLISIDYIARNKNCLRLYQYCRIGLSKEENPDGSHICDRHDVCMFPGDLVFNLVSEQEDIRTIYTFKDVDKNSLKIVEYDRNFIEEEVWLSITTDYKKEFDDFDISVVPGIHGFHVYRDIRGITRLEKIGTRKENNE